MKTYFDIEKAEAQMRQAHQTLLDRARSTCTNADDLAVMEEQARLLPAQIDIMKTMLTLSNEGMDDKRAAMAVSAFVAGLIKSCDMMLPGQRFHVMLTHAMELMEGRQGVISARGTIKPEPLS